jgi:hypothetical protein
VSRQHLQLAVLLLRVAAMVAQVLLLAGHWQLQLAADQGVQGLQTLLVAAAGEGARLAVVQAALQQQQQQQQLVMLQQPEGAVAG